MSAPFIITGAGTYTDVYPRLDILDMQKDHPEQFTLLILAWEKIMDKDYRPLATQFEHIAGIHGMPYVPWLGDPDEAAQTTRGLWLGYCNHGSIMFPNWHRPYIMLIEQVICEVAYGIAGEYAVDPQLTPDQAAKWLQAARELRFPFWDWLRPDTGTKGFPELFKQEKVELLKPGGKESHKNILAFYKFDQPVNGFYNRLELIDPQDPEKKQAMSYFKQWNRTYRRPNSSPVAVTEDYQALDADLMNDDPLAKGSWANLTHDISGIFGFPIDIAPELYANAWDEFSNTTFQSGRRDKNERTKFHSPFVWNCPPIEQPHNRVHLVVGGLGHMGENDAAGFDPIFYLHHCNVDRLLSFWEHIYPDYVAGTEGYLDVDGMTRVPFMQSDGTFIETINQVVDDETPLMPFRKSDYTYWNSKDTHSLGFNSDDTLLNKYYTYPAIGPVELNPKNPLTPEEREIQRGYLQDHFKYNPIKHLEPKNLVQHRLFQKIAPYGGKLPPNGRAVENYRQFIVTASLSPRYFEGSYLLKVFMEINKKSVEVGSIAVLGRGKSSGCGNCQAKRAADARVRGVILIPHEVVTGVLEAAPMIPMTVEGEDRGDLRGDGEQDLIKALRTGLSSCVVLPSGRVHSRLSKTGSMSGVEPNDSEPAISLRSCDVYQPHLGGQYDQAKAPFSFYDWKDHGSPFGDWSKDV
ncbi:Di-copper centre-containing protein [Ceratobasidium sp. AG-I]|nr:Di-copper centre-containing protein [Ceratobasidium sp. AG-I]